MKNLAIIPARGGSKRIPRKNIKPFLGKPIILYSIETAINSGLFEEVMVSTDDLEIKSLAEDAGAKVPFLRSAKNADDQATLANVFEEVKSGYKNANFNFYCIILPTAPFITIDLLNEGIEFLADSAFDSARPVVSFPYPVQKAQVIKNGKLEFLYPDYKFSRSQDLVKSYHDAGLFYWIKKNKQLSKGERGGFEISAEFAHDIDDEQDWKLAELKYKVLKQS